MVQKYFWVINIIFICFFSFLASKISNTYILDHFSSSELKIDSTRSTGNRARKSVKRKNSSHYLPISRKNIFNSDYSGETDKSKKKDEPKNSSQLKKTELNVTLIGTVAGDREDSFAIIEDNKSRKQELFQVDDMIQDQAQVLNISRCQVVVLREGEEEILECEKDEESGRKKRPSPVRHTATSSGKKSYAVKKVSDSDYMIDESEVENALNNINKLMTQIRVVPNFKDGQANGFKVFAIKPDSIFAKIGLKNGDVIQNINDQDITSPDKAFLAFQELRNEKNFSVSISRRGQAKTMQYEIR